MVEITEYNSGEKIMKSKSLRDEVISDKIKDDCGLCKNSGCYYIVGTPGSGKSHLAESLFKKQFKNCFDAVFLVCPENSRSGYKNSYCQKMNPCRVYDELTFENLETIKDEVDDVNSEGDKKNPSFSALIIDDCASDLRNKHTMKLLLKMCQNHRHNRLSIFIISQNLQMLHKSLRDVMTVLIQFKTSSLKEVKAINEEFLPNLKPDEVMDVLGYIFKDKYSFLLINRRNNLICKNFNSLDIDTGRDF